MLADHVVWPSSASEDSAAPTQLLNRMEDPEAMADSSFDIVSKLDHQEVDNALSQAAREIAQR